MTNGRINVAHARKKRRLDSELERMLEGIEQKRIGMAQMESKAAEKVRQRDEKELEMIELEREVTNNNILLKSNNLIIYANSAACESFIGTTTTFIEQIGGGKEFDWPVSAAGVHGGPPLAPTERPVHARHSGYQQAKTRTGRAVIVTYLSSIVLIWFENNFYDGDLSFC